MTPRSDGLDFLRVEVRDENSRMPVLAGPFQGGTSGRGVAVVSAVAVSRGNQQEGDGKVVWAEIGERSSPDDVECLDLRDLASVDHSEGGTPRWCDRLPRAGSSGRAG